MAQPDATPDRVLAAVAGDTALLRVEGRGGFRHAPALRDFGAHVQCETRLRRIIVDMLACRGLDSTFMGVLAGLAHRFRSRSGGEVAVVNLNPHTYGLLTTLGLDRILRVCLVRDTPPEWTELLHQATPRDLSPAGVDADTTRAAMIEAHETLTRLKPENEVLFRDVIDFLRKETPAAPSPGEPKHRKDTP